MSTAQPLHRSHIHGGITLAGATLMVMFDTTVTNVALPHFTEIFGTALSTTQWVTTAYVLTLIAVMPLSAWAMARWGATSVYITALTVFTVGSLAAALSWNIESLIVFRAFQGLGGGFLQPVGMAIAFGAVADNQRGRMMAILGLPLMVGPVFGPTLGGLLLDSLGWRWLFGINIPLGLVIIAAATKFLPPLGASTASARRIDGIGLATLSPAGVLLVLGLSRVTDGSASIVALPIITGLALAAIFIWRALHVESPLLDIRLLGRRHINSAVVPSALFSCGYFGSMALMPLYVQAVRGDSATTAGLIVMAQAMSAAIMAQISSRLVDRVPPYYLIIPGVLCSTVASAFIALAIFVQAGYPILVGIGVMMGMGVGATGMPLTIAATRGTSGPAIGSLTTIISAVQQLAFAVGTALLSAALTGFLSATTSVLHHGGIGAALALDHQQRHDAAASMSVAVAATYACVAAIFAITGLTALRLIRSTDRDGRADHRAGADVITLKR